MTSVVDVVALGKQAVVMRSRDVTRSLEPSFFVPGVLKSFKDERVLAEVGPGGGRRLQRRRAGTQGTIVACLDGGLGV